ncbi:MAG: DNA methyltransferase [Lentisphaerae bacterium RIFOXYB12_FULL_65_16]|nr:MAG: DNA methyltransferase [Lentisphaerae bacterium RIFOXYA12_64_32]OGV88220.1 MAG: DNA methyltransferase [Lentisphaerae bacterium RIFOXYB12_FULL_65_16]
MALDLSALESWLWEAACVIRGPVDAPKFKDYILPLIFLKRLSDVFDDEVKHNAAEFGSEAMALKLIEQDHKLVRFFIPKVARWPEIARRTTGLGEYLTDAVRAVARENPRLNGVINVTDFNATQAGQRTLDDGRLTTLVQVLNAPDKRLGLDDVDRDLLGDAYEYLLRKFAEGQGSSAGEFLTPPEVGRLMALILDPQPGQTVYDSNCGSAGLLIKTHLRLVEKCGVRKNGTTRLPANLAPLRLFGQEINPATFAMARMNAVIHDMEAEIALGDTMAAPKFTSAEGALRRFDLVTANPMWNQKFPAANYENDTFDRFTRGVPPTSSADWGWVQHMDASLTDTGKLAVVLDTGAVSRGSGNQGSNKERDVRKAFVEADLVEAVFLLPENLFYNTTAPGIILVVNHAKKHPGEILLVNGSKQFSKGRPKNFLDDAHVAAMADAYLKWQPAEALAAVITKADAAKNDYNLSPSRYVSVGEQVEVLPLDEAVVELREAEEERDAADRELEKVLKKLGL